MAPANLSGVPQPHQVREECLAAMPGSQSLLVELLGQGLGRNPAVCSCCVPLMSCVIVHVHLCTLKLFMFTQGQMIAKGLKQGQIGEKSQFQNPNFQFLDPNS